MSFEEDLMANVRAALVGAGAVREIRMFGGTGFMLNGNMVVAASRRGLLVRAGKDRQREALARPGARQMVMRGRTLDGYVYVDPPAIMHDAAVRAWVTLALAFVRSLPAKPAKSTAAAKPRPKTARRTQSTRPARPPAPLETSRRAATVKPAKRASTGASTQTRSKPRGAKARRKSGGSS